MFLQQALKKYLQLDVVLVHSSIGQEQRVQLFDQMRLLKLRVVLASDLLARGVDLPEVAFVLNYDAPTTWQEYLHRIGRSGRQGLKGLALTLVTQDEQQIFSNEQVSHMQDKQALLDFLDDKFVHVQEDYTQIDRTNNQKQMIGKRQ